MKPMSPLQPMRAPERWWPEALGDHPHSSGGQNDVRYVYFADKKRLVVDAGDGKNRVYDTGDHDITGVQQHQDGSSKKLTFTSQHGEMDLEKLSRA